MYNTLDKLLNKLKSATFKVNAEKSFFARNKLEYLGFKITRQNIMPLPDKVEDMKNIAVPMTEERFIDLINYDRDMWKY